MEQTEPLYKIENGISNSYRPNLTPAASYEAHDTLFQSLAEMVVKDVLRGVMTNAEPGVTWDLGGREASHRIN